MNRIMLTALALVVAAPLSSVLPMPASAQTVSDCQTLISNLRSDVLGVTITGKNGNKDQEALLDRLDAASDRLTMGKTVEAIDKLVDFTDKVEKFAAAGHISPDDASLLVAQAQEAIACINSTTAV